MSLINLRNILALQNRCQSWDPHHQLPVRKMNHLANHAAVTQNLDPNSYNLLYG